MVLRADRANCEITADRSDSLKSMLIDRLGSCCIPVRLDVVCPLGWYDCTDVFMSVMLRIDLDWHFVLPVKRYA